MKLYDINGKPRSRMVSKYLINWKKKSKSKKSHEFRFLPYMAAGEPWWGAKYSYGVWERFADQETQFWKIKC